MRISDWSSDVCSSDLNTVIRGDFGQITIGDRTNIQDNSMIHVTGGDYDTFIGNDVLIGHSCIIHGCRLHDFAYVGLGAIVLDGAEIEPTGMLAGGAMLTPNKRIREGELWAGRPAKFVRRLEEHEIDVNKSGISLYLERSEEHTSELQSL